MRFSSTVSPHFKDPGFFLKTCSCAMLFAARGLAAPYCHVLQQGRWNLIVLEFCSTFWTGTMPRWSFLRGRERQCCRSDKLFVWPVDPFKKSRSENLPKRIIS